MTASNVIDKRDLIHSRIQFDVAKLTRYSNKLQNTQYTILGSVFIETVFNVLILFSKTHKQVIFDLYFLTELSIVHYGVFSMKER